MGQGEKERRERGEGAWAPLARVNEPGRMSERGGVTHSFKRYTLNSHNRGAQAIAPAVRFLFIATR